MNIKIATSTITFAFLLSGCGGGGGGSAAAPVALPKVAAMPTLSYTPVKGFKFNWTDVSDATSYKILENKNGASGFSKIGNDIAQGVGTTTQTVPLHKRLNAQYILQSCTTAGCIDSAAISVTGTLVDSIGYVKASNTANTDYFGLSISLSGDGSTLAVGNSNADNIPAVSSSGAVYIFTRTGSMWRQQDILKSKFPQASAFFGDSVSLSSNGNTLVVGEPNRDTSSVVDPGAAYIFTRTDSKWTLDYTVASNNPLKDDYFGRSVSLSGDGNTVAIGAPGDVTKAGVVEISLITASGLNFQETLSGNSTGGEFGKSVSLNSDGATLAVGAPKVDNGSVTDSGEAYIYTRTGVTWTYQQVVSAITQETDDKFGRSVSLSGDGNTLAVGAVGDDSNARGVKDQSNSEAAESNSGAQDSGAAYIFNRSGTVWKGTAYVKAMNTGSGDEFGYSVSLSSDGSTLAVGAEKEDSNAIGLGGTESDNSALASGAVYTFSLTGSAWTQQAYVKASNTQEDDQFGYSVSLSSDGSTLAVAAPFEDSNATGIDGNASDNSASGSGAVYLY